MAMVRWPRGCPSIGPHICVLPQYQRNERIDFRLNASDRGIDSAPYVLVPGDAGWDLEPDPSKKQGPKSNISSIEAWQCNAGWEEVLRSLGQTSTR